MTVVRTLSQAKGNSVAVVNCQVKVGQGGRDVKIMVTNRTKVEASPSPSEMPEEPT